MADDVDEQYVVVLELSVKGKIFHLLNWFVILTQWI